MSSNYHRNLGEQFKKAVSDGLATGDFRELNILVNDTVSDAISQAGQQIRQTSSESRKEPKEKTFSSADSKKQNIAPKAKPKTKPVGQVSGILYMVFGGMGTGITSIILLSALICGLLGFFWPLPLVCFIALIWCGSLFAIRTGIVKKNRLNRMKRYVSLCAGKMYVNIADLARGVGKNTRYIIKDIRKMIQIGIFPEGHFDEKETCLMLDDATFHEYLKLEKERKALNQAAAAQSAPTQPEKPDNLPPELQTVIREGKDYIRRLHELNDLIPGEVISAKLYRMENLLREIFAQLEDDPTQLPQMRKLMNYYLPTTIRLLESYAEFDNVSSPGADMLSAKAQIEATVDTINEAFAELLNKLFQAAVFDVTADAQVLKAMLEKEGLTKNDFS